MKFTSLEIRDVILIEPPVYRDDRGFFLETYQKSKFSEAGINKPFVQDNFSHSVKGVIRGLHYQIKQPQGKLIQVVRGEIFDVAVDLRMNSPTFGNWVGEYLSDDNRRQLWIPEGFAHGFLAVSESVDITYKCTDYYAPEFERTLLWSDPQVGIKWPLGIGSMAQLSEKDLRGNLLKAAEVYK